MSKPKGAMDTSAAHPKEQSLGDFYSNALDNYTTKTNASQPDPIVKEDKPKKEEPKKTIVPLFDKEVKQELLGILVSNKLNIVEANDDCILFETKDGHKMVLVPCEEN